LAKAVAEEENVLEPTIFRPATTRRQAMRTALEDIMMLKKCG
jgi:hypothetical protein